jgi:hypothetical protein
MAKPDTPCHFAFIVKGSAGKLLVGPRKPADKDVAEAKKALGGSLIRGICFGDGDTIVFQSSLVPNPAWEACVKKLAKADAGMTINAEFREAGQPAPSKTPEKPSESQESEGEGDGSLAKTPTKPDTKSETSQPGKPESQKEAEESYPVPEGSEANDYAAWLKLCGPVVKEALAAKPANAAEISKLANDSTILNKGGNTQAAIKKLEAAYKLAQAVLKAKKASDGKTGGEKAGDTKPGGNLGDWPKIREDILGKLRTLSKEVDAEKHEESAKAVLELNAVIKNITAEPRTAKQIGDLKKWLSEDDIVADVCELAFDIRKPLLGALSKIQPVSA